MNKIYQQITDKIIAQLEAGTIPWRKPWKGATSTPKNLISGKAYTGINFFILAMSAYDSPYFLTYKQAKAMGGNVRKGEKGTHVIYYGIGKDKKEDNKSFRFLKQYVVFNVNQCENLDHSRIEEAKDIEPLEFNPIEKAEAIYNGYIGKPTLQFVENQAYYKPITDVINMPKKESFHSVEEFYCCLFHECVHSSGSEKRLNRPELTDLNAFGSHEYSKEELTAEFGAAYLCAIAGIDNTLENSSAYIKGWLSKLKNNNDWLVGAASKAQKAADYIQGNLDKN